MTGTEDGPPDAAPEISEGLAAIGGDIRRELFTLGERAEEFDRDTLPRFSGELADVLAPDEIVELNRQVEALGPWLQGPFVLGGDYVISGQRRRDLRWAQIGELVPDLEDKRVLDVVCDAGYDAFMLALRGATRVVALEPSARIGQARFLEGLYTTGIELRQIGWRDLDPSAEAPFDFVFCDGVLEREANPLGLLLRLRATLAQDGELLLGSVVHADSRSSDSIRFVPDAYAGDESIWFVPGRQAMLWMLESAGFEAQELLFAEGPRGEFPTMTAFYGCRPGQTAGGLCGGSGEQLRRV